MEGFLQKVRSISLSLKSSSHSLRSFQRRKRNRFVQGTDKPRVSSNQLPCKLPPTHKFRSISSIHKSLRVRYAQIISLQTRMKEVWEKSMPLNNLFYLCQMKSNVREFFNKRKRALPSIPRYQDFKNFAFGFAFCAAFGFGLGKALPSTLVGAYFKLNKVEEENKGAYNGIE